MITFRTFQGCIITIVAPSLKKKTSITGKYITLNFLQKINLQEINFENLQEFELS